MPRFIRVRTSSSGSGDIASTAGGSGGNRSSSGTNTTATTSSNNNGIGPFGMSGLGMGFGLYRPRRPSYTLATQACRQRSESYRYATRRDNTDFISDVDVHDGEDFIDGVIKRTSRQASFVKEGHGSREREEKDKEDEEGLPHEGNVYYDNDDDDDNVIVTTAAAAAVSRAMTPETRLPQVDVFITKDSEESAGASSSAFNLSDRSCSEQFLLDSTNQMPMESNCCNRNVPNHLSLYSTRQPSCLGNFPESSLSLQPGVNGNGTTPTVGRSRPLSDHRSPHTPHNDLAHAIPLPPEAIAKKRKTLTRSFACGEAETDNLDRESSKQTITVSVTSPDTTVTATPDSNSSTTCGTETVVVGLLTPVNGRANTIYNGNGNNGNSSHSERRQKSVSYKKHKLPSMSSFSFTKNLIVLCLGFIFVYSSFRAIQNLQSSVNGGNDLGVITMALVHISMVFASLLAPIIINVFTAKWAMCGGVMCFLAWFSAHIHPTFWTLVPTSLLVGLGQAVIWNAESSYVLKLAFDSAAASGSRGNLDQEMFRFHGIFLACFQSTHIWGNLISSLMLSWYKDQLLKVEDSSSDFKGIPVGAWPEAGDGAVLEDGVVGDYGGSFPAGNDSLYDGYNMGYEGEEITVDVYCGTLHRCTPGQDQLMPDMPGKTRDVVLPGSHHT